MAAGVSSYVDEDDSVIGDINVTPLVDIILVLLIVYMITVPSIVKNPAIKVELPTAASGTSTPDTTLNLMLQLDAAGQIAVYANGEVADEEKLRSIIPPLLEQNQELAAVIAADKGIAYGDVVQVVDLIGSLGVGRIALETRLPSAD
jgi:biopolymer transport protein ExbD